MEIVTIFLSLIIVIPPLVVTSLIVMTNLTGAPYKATTPDKISTILKLAQITKKDRCADIGAGDGRVVAAMATLGHEAHGFEINPLLVWLGRKRIKRAGLETKAQLHWKNFWQQDFSQFSVVTVYGTNHIMGSLEKKLKRELTKGSRVVSNVFAFPTWEETRIVDRVRLYIV